jgi:hypothetical protein
VKSFEYEPGVCEEPPDFQLMMDIFIGKLDAVRCITVSSSRIRQLRHRVVVPVRQDTWAGGTVRQSYAGVNFIPQSGIYEFGYWTYIHR